MLAKIISRLNWAIQAFTAPLARPQIELSNGVRYDVENRRLIIPADFSIHTEGTLKLSASKHVIIKSGRGNEDRPGYVYGIWVNCKEDEFGQPLLEDDSKIIEADDGCNKHTKY